MFPCFLCTKLYQSSTSTHPVQNLKPRLYRRQINKCSSDGSLTKQVAHTIMVTQYPNMGGMKPNSPHTMMVLVGGFISKWIFWKHNKRMECFKIQKIFSYLVVFYTVVVYAKRNSHAKFQSNQCALSSILVPECSEDAMFTTHKISAVHFATTYLS